MNAIEVQNLTKDFGSFRAVDDVSFDVPFGAVTGFVGVNGSGKTTTMRAMLNLAPPTSGSARFGGHLYTELQKPRTVVGAVVDCIGAHPSHSARRHLTMITTAANLPISRVDEVLNEVGLIDVADKPLKKYSMGMTQRCALAGALLGNPKILVLDEPANGLDPSGIRWLRTTTRGWADEGRAVFVSSHQIAELAVVIDHLAVMHEGRLVHHGPLSDLTNSSDDLESAVFDLLADFENTSKTPATETSPR